MESVEERKNREEAEKKAKEEKRVESKSNKLETEIALVSGDANRFIAEAFVEQKANSGVSAKDKNFSRRVLREVKRYERTGRVSSWLASEFTKAQALRDTTSKKAQEQPESVPSSSIGATVPIPNAPTGYEFKPIEFTPPPTTEFPPHPWQITIRTVPESNPPEYEYQIESSSRLFDGVDGEEISVDGADGEWRNLDEGFFFIEIDFKEDGTVEQSQIQIEESVGNRVESSGDPPTQTKARQRIGYVYFDEDTPKVRQEAFHNFTLLYTGVNGVVCKIPFAT